MVPTVRFLSVRAPALVLGSTQPLASVDVPAGAGIEIARRRSGGGAVLLQPGSVLWVDVLVPSGDGLWDDDVGRAAHWLGETWILALGDLGVQARWHDDALVARLWSQLVCFGGLGAGEVTVAGRKVVGISQRRMRAGAQFQCAALLAWDPGALVSFLVLDGRSQAELTAQLEKDAVGLGVDEGELEMAFVRRVAER
jgi:lipoate-protein ligase A